MIPFKPGDIILIGFPFTDLSGSKQRPALIISNKWYNERKKDIILAAITSQVPSKIAKDEYLLSPEEQKAAGLPKKSIVKVGKIITVDQRLIRKKIGHISEETQLLIKKILLNIHI